MTAPAPAVDLRLRRLDLRAPGEAARRERDALFRRGAVPDPKVREATRAILADVREGVTTEERDQPAIEREDHAVHASGKRTGICGLARCGQARNQVQCRHEV